MCLNDPEAIYMRYIRIIWKMLVSPRQRKYEQLVRNIPEVELPK